MAKFNKEVYRQSKEYKTCVEKIKNYRKGFEFDVPYWKMTQPQWRAMDIVLTDCKQMGLIESISIDLDISFTVVSERYKRL